MDACRIFEALESILNPSIIKSCREFKGPHIAGAHKTFWCHSICADIYVLQPLASICCLFSRRWVGSLGWNREICPFVQDFSFQMVHREIQNRISFPEKRKTHLYWWVISSLHSSAYEPGSLVHFVHTFTAQRCFKTEILQLKSHSIEASKGELEYFMSAHQCPRDTT